MTSEEVAEAEVELAAAFFLVCCERCLLSAADLGGGDVMLRLNWAREPSAGVDPEWLSPGKSGVMRCI